MTIDKWAKQWLYDKRSCITLAAFGAVFLFFTPSWSADWAVSPQVRIIEEYNDNILFSRDEKALDDFVTYVRPEIEGIYRTEEFNLSLTSGLEAEKYLDYDELDTTDHDHRLALAYALSPTLDLRTGGYYREDTLRETELAEEGLLVDREDRRKFGGTLGFNYAVSPLFALSADWTRSGTEYPEDPGTISDRRSDTFTLVPRYILGPQTNLFLNLKYARTEYGRYDDPKIRNYTISPSFRHDFAEDFYVFAEIGYRHTEHRSEGESEHTDGFIYTLLFHRDWEAISMELLGSRDQYATVEGRSVERDRITLKGAYRLTQRLQGDVSATFRRNREDEGDDDSDYFTVTPSFSYDLTPTVVLGVSANYSRYYYEENSERDRERFKARLVLSFRWPRLLSGH